MTNLVKNNTRIAVTLSHQCDRYLNQISNETGYSKSFIVQSLITLYGHNLVITDDILSAVLDTSDCYRKENDER